jgi:hypothetical protein
MTYDFRMFACKPNEDPLVLARRESPEFSESAPDPANEARKHHLADALKRLHPYLMRFSFDYEKIAIFEGITVEQAGAKYRHIELTDSREGNGVRIIIFDDEVWLTAPYWHPATTAAEVFREIWSYLGLIEQEVRYASYDVQLERILDIDKDFDIAFQRYIRAVRYASRHFL